MFRPSSFFPAVLAIALLAAGCAAPAGKPGSMPAEPFGMAPEGEPVEVYTLRNSRGAEARIATYGATVISLKVPDREGRLGDVVLGFDRLADYAKPGASLGCVLGRTANRIAKGRFALDGRTFTLAVNAPPNHLHGGARGFGRVVWEAHPREEERPPSLELRTISEHGEEGYPGSLVATVVYTLTDENALRVDFRAASDRPTVCNLTQRLGFNLAGEGNVLDHVATIKASRFTPVDAGLIPTGELRPVEGTPFDFRRPSRIGARIHASDEQLKFGRGYDHNWVLDKPSGRLGLAAEVFDPASGRALEVWTTLPGLQFSCGNLEETDGKGGQAYGPSSGFFMEPQFFPDSPNRPEFPSVTLRPGQTWRHTILYKFSAR